METYILFWNVFLLADYFLIWTVEMELCDLPFQWKMEERSSSHSNLILFLSYTSYKDSDSLGNEVQELKSTIYLVHSH